MNRSTTIVVVAALLIGIGLGYALRRPAPSAMGVSMSASPVASMGERKALYWYDPMRPDQHFDKPGKSPFMDMQLLPKYTDEGTASLGAGGVTVNARTVQNLGIRTALVERGALAPAITVLGTIAYDESTLDVVQARARGYLEHVYVRKPLTSVRRGQALAELVAPEWASAEAEYRALRGLSGPNLETLRAAARQRLVILGLPADSIRHLDRTGEVGGHVALVAPRDGVITELDAHEGQAVEPGMPLFRINGLATVWVNADVPEAQSAAVREDAQVSVTVSAWPGRQFIGTVSAVLPQVDPTTRTLRVRIELSNSDGALTPGMFANVAVHASAGEPQLLVPSEAVIRTGERNVVIVAEAAGHFRPVEVKIGAEADGKTAILDGLHADARVVVSGQFLIDSEANLRGSLTRMSVPAEERKP
jgi:Cu(I)/Ag(I) efflux system membrane fusion protein